MDKKLRKAFNVVLDLAEQNIIDDPEMAREAAKQEAAIELVRAYYMGDHPRLVRILVGGGVAHLASAVEGVTVEIIDYDNAGPDKDEEGRPCSIDRTVG